MRHSAPTPTGSPPLPFPSSRASRRRRTVGSVELAREAIENFNALLHDLRMDAPQIDADAIASVARWLDSQPAEQRDLLVQLRLSRLDELKAMRTDPDWPLDPAQAHRIDLILEYVARENDLIPDHIPVYGYLDDALLLELAWPTLDEDVADYRDFCNYRAEVATRSGQSVNQLDWLQARSEEGALWEQLHRVHEQQYIEYRTRVSLFRVS